MLNQALIGFRSADGCEVLCTFFYFLFGYLIFFVILWDNRSKDLTKINTEINAIILTFYFGLFY